LISRGLKSVAVALAVISFTFAGLSSAQAIGTTASVQRISGADRFATAVEVSKGFSPGVRVAYVAVGSNFPDALAAAPAASLGGGPLLLSQKDVLPDVVKAELARLQPQKIVVVGGQEAISNAVFDDLAGRTNAIERVAGSDRFETGRNIVRNAFEGGASSAYIATGANFPDALSAAGAAGSRGLPVILVQGSSAGIDSATAALIRDLGVSDLKIVGGTATISTGVESSLSQIPGITSVQRFAGTDRYETSRLVNAEAFSRIPSAFIAVGTNFPDALAGAARAGSEKMPLIVVPGNCIPQQSLDLMSTRGLSTLTLLGGPATLSTAVEATVPCFDPAPLNASGSYRVGVDVQPGTYWTSATNGCYWERVSSFDGSFESIIANNYTSGPQIVTVEATDVGFNTSDCGTWVGLQNATPLGQIPGSATVAITLQVSPGTYRSENRDGGCYWARLSGFSGEITETTANGYVDSGPVVVAIAANDVGFESRDCGSWTRLR
jgi:putative cell wall-binding protein